MLSVKLSNLIKQNKNIFEKIPFSAAFFSRVLRMLNPLSADDICFVTRFMNSYALEPEKDSTVFQKTMSRLECYLGAGPFSNKKHWEYPWVLSNLRLSRGLSVLDAGCGKSPLQFLLADLGMKVTGVDLHEGDAWHGINRRLARRFGAKIDYKIEGIDSLSFPDSSFDRVMCVSVLEHCRKRHYAGDDAGDLTPEDKEFHKKIIAELLRVLKPRGLLVLTFDFFFPRSNFHPGNNIDINNIITAQGAKLNGSRCVEAFPGEEGFDPVALIYNSDIYFDNYQRGLQTSIGLVLKKAGDLANDKAYASS